MIPPAWKAAARAHARDVAVARELDDAVAPWTPYRYVPSAPANAGSRDATLHIDDVSGVPFLQDIVGVQHYQLRTRVRAGDGDIYAAACPEVPGYEAYCRDRLGLGAPGFVLADPVGPPIEVAEACRRGRAFDAIVATARAAGALVIHPYMGIEAVWALAGDVAAAAGVPVRVLGPPPAITDYANDKACVTALAATVVTALVGWDAAIPTRVATEPGAIAEALGALAEVFPRVALKMTRFASAMGNRVLDADAVRAAGPAGRLAITSRFLADKRWRPGQEVLAVAWYEDAVSPSTQLWIPPDGAGPPRVEGVYEQLLVGPERVFLGSIPSRLGADVDRRMSDASLIVAEIYQALGYVGRCSFDFILVDGLPRFVECNGRWGGTSTPMHLVDRLFPAGRPAYRARDFVDPALVGCTFEALVAALPDDLLYDARTGRGRFILYNTGCLEPFGKLDVIALGASTADATDALERLFPAAISRVTRVLTNELVEPLP